MVCMNESITFKKLELKKNLKKEFTKMVKLEFDMILNEKIIEKINNKINKKTNELFESDHFIYINMDDNICTHKFKKGKKEGYFCCKKIRTNLEGQKEDYLCVTHSKKHIPKKKNIKKYINSTTKNKINIFNSDILKNKDHDIYFKHIKNKKIMKKKRLNKKIICNGIINFKDIINKLLLI